jgi:hypothetical protein
VIIIAKRVESSYTIKIRNKYIFENFKQGINDMLINRKMKTEFIVHYSICVRHGCSLVGCDQNLLGENYELVNASFSQEEYFQWLMTEGLCNLYQLISRTDFLSAEERFCETNCDFKEVMGVSCDCSPDVTVEFITDAETDLLVWQNLRRRRILPPGATDCWDEAVSGITTEWQHYMDLTYVPSPSGEITPNGLFKPAPMPLCSCCGSNVTIN